MRRTWLGTVVLLAACGCHLRADWKITTRSTFGAHQTIETEYFKGGLRRSDEIDQATGRVRYVRVLDMDDHRQITWDRDTRQYTEYWFNRAMQPPPTTGPVVVIDRTTRDTGERRSMFGRPARHMTTREQREGEVTEIDGWYIDSEKLPRELHAAAVATLVLGDARTIPILKVNQIGPRPGGLAVWERRTSERTSSEEMIGEVTELTEGPLDARLFEPPPQYRRVPRLDGNGAALSWLDRLRLDWERLEDWLSAF